ncbi:MAG: CRISPR-associated DxTHG motif protein [Faecalibacillus intestinalis]|uniref:CRISPR-associated DxTHG motif protein n=1 Tax=Faecalibacillus intestinalis TaxID=1982626 RepID=UPI003993FB22
MQYFTFLGVGTLPEGYEEALYSFEDNKEEIHASKYVQSAIIEKFQSAISEVFVFCTEKSYSLGARNIKNEIKTKFNIDIKFITINEFVKIEEILQKMDEVLKEDFIIDVTHSFRNIPISVTMISNYLEVSTKKQLKHLFYGNYNRETNEGLIIDLINQYENSKIASSLMAFDQFLKISDTYLYNLNDNKINNLMKGIYQFNHMLDYCEFDSCVHSISQIYNFCQSILKEKDKYILLTPYLKSIQKKLSNIYIEKNDAIKKIKFIKLLLAHNSLQIAITFTDPLIREELVHYYYFPDSKSFKEELLNKIAKESDFYDLSTDLLFFLNIRNSSKNINSKDYIVNIRNKNNNLSKDVSLLDKENINIFYIKIRNVVNHGGKIDQNIDVNKIILKCLDSIEKFIKEG